MKTFQLEKSRFTFKMFRIHSSKDFFRIQKFQMRQSVKLNKMLFLRINHLFRVQNLFVLITPFGGWESHLEALEVKKV